MRQRSRFIIETRCRIPAIPYSRLQDRRFQSLTTKIGLRHYKLMLLRKCKYMMH